MPVQPVCSLFADTKGCESTMDVSNCVRDMPAEMGSVVYSVGSVWRMIVIDLGESLFRVAPQGLIGASYRWPSQQSVASGCPSLLSGHRRFLVRGRGDRYSSRFWLWSLDAWNTRKTLQRQG
jgi:hypothetical protein